MRRLLEDIVTTGVSMNFVSISLLHASSPASRNVLPMVTPLIITLNHTIPVTPSVASGTDLQGFPGNLSTNHSLWPGSYKVIMKLGTAPVSTNSIMPLVGTFLTLRAALIWKFWAQSNFNSCTGFWCTSCCESNIQIQTKHYITKYSQRAVLEHRSDRAFCS